MGLSTEQLVLVEHRVANDGPSSGVTYLLWFFLGVFAGHRWYLGRPGSAVLMIIAWICGILPGAIWWIVDGFLIPGMIREKKDEIRRRVQQDLLVAQGG
jgi:hypothetical protein